MEHVCTFSYYWTPIYIIVCENIENQTIVFSKNQIGRVFIILHTYKHIDIQYIHKYEKRGW